MKQKQGLAYILEATLPDGSVERSELARNLMPDEGRNHMWGVTLHGEAPFPTWYVSLYQGDYTPVPTVTAATYAGAATECTAYAESTRPEYKESAPAGGATNNEAEPAVFTLNAPVTIYGVALISSSAKGATTGKLLSIARLPSPKVYDAGAVVRVIASPYLLSDD